MSPDPVQNRVEKLEFIVAHLQKSVDDLSQSIINQQKQIDSLGRQVAQVRLDIRSTHSADNTPRTLEDDRPPHY